jgi:hypothetical protein
MPEIFDCLTIGFNSTVRRLEALSQKSIPPNRRTSTEEDQPMKQEPANLAIVFVCRENLPDIMTTSLPLLITTSSSKPSRARLVNISRQTEARIAEALGQVRVGVLGLQEDDQRTGALTTFVRDNVDRIEVPWLEPAHDANYLPVTIKSSETGTKSKPAAEPRKKKRRKSG